MSDQPGSEVTFEDGYEELKRIVTRLDAEDVTVHEMCELFARGKGLERALRGYLERQKGKLDEIEAGENLPDFTIIAPSPPGAVGPPDKASEAAPLAPEPPPAGDDDIPF